MSSMEAIATCPQWKPSREGRATKGDNLSHRSLDIGAQRIVVGSPNVHGGGCHQGARVKRRSFLSIRRNWRKLRKKNLFNWNASVPKWSNKTVRAIRGEFINYRSSCEDRDLWTTGGSSVLIASEY